MKVQEWWARAWRGLGVLLGCAALVACGGGGGGDTGSTVAAGGGAPVPTVSGTSTPAARAQWTYLVYLAADNNLSEDAAEDIREMTQAVSSDEVRVVVQMDQSTAYSGVAGRTTRRGLVKNGSVQWTDLGRDVDTSTPAALQEFIQWGRATYPSDKVALVLWSHGGGWKTQPLKARTRGVLNDGTSLMSIRDLAGVLRQTGPVDLLNFDACVMGMYEVAYEMRNLATVMVASEENVPGTGQPYHLILNHLVAHPAMTASDLGRQTVIDYRDHYAGLANFRGGVTMSALNLSKMDALHAAIGTLSASLVTELDTNRGAVDAARAATVSYEENFLDLIGFASQLSLRIGGATRTAADAVVARTGESIIYNVVEPGGTNIGMSAGLSIYVPAAGSVSAQEVVAYRADLTSSSGSGAWASFVEKLVSGSTSGGAQFTLVPGAFAYYITWDNPNVDLDLMVNEPRGQWAGPVFGSSSGNGYASSDSALSGRPFESYVASAQVEAGAFDVFVRRYACHPGVLSCGDTTVSVYRLDPALGDADYRLVAQRRMSASPALVLGNYATLGQLITAVNTGAYGDWYYVSQVVKAQVSEKPTSAVSFKADKVEFLPK